MVLASQPLFSVFFRPHSPRPLAAPLKIQKRGEIAIYGDTASACCRVLRVESIIITVLENGLKAHSGGSSGKYGIYFFHVTDDDTE